MPGFRREGVMREVSPRAGALGADAVMYSVLRDDERPG